MNNPLRLPTPQRPPAGVSHQEACAFQAAHQRAVATVYAARGEHGKARRAESSATWWDNHGKAVV